MTALLPVALRGLRSRWIGVTTIVLAVALGCGLTAVTGLVLAGTADAPGRPPARYAHAAAVVLPEELLRVTTGHGERAQDLAEPRGLSPEVLDRLRGAGPVVLDRVFPAGHGLTGRPWSAAALSGTLPLSGRAPTTDGEVLLAATGHSPGERVVLYGPGGEGREYIVSGTAAPVGEEPTAFFTDAEAARLSPRVDAAVPADASAAALAGPGVTVLSGADRRLADPAAERDARALTAAAALAGTAGGVAVFVSIFIVASTSSFAVTRRRGEFALLRAAGVSPGQVRRLVLGEALLLGGLGATLGVLIARPAAALAGERLIALGTAPPWFTPGDATWPLWTAAATALLVSLTGAHLAARRAGRVRPAEALGEPTLDGRLPVPRVLCGLAALAGAVAMIAQPLLSGAPGALLKRKQYTPMVLLLLLALAALAPLLVPPLARLLSAALSRTRGATGMLAGASALGAPTRTAATAAPILLTVGLSVCLLGVNATVDHARATEDAGRIAADMVVLPAGAPALPDALLAKLRALPGTSLTASRETTLFEVEEDTALVRRGAHAVDPGDLSPVLNLPVTAGTPTLDDTTIIVDAEWGHDVGETVHIWRGDGTEADLRVTAVIREGAGGNGAYVTTAHAPRTPAGEALLRLTPDADREAVRELAASAGARALTRDEWRTTALAGRDGGVSRVGIQVVLGLSVAYTALFTAGTLAIATRERRGELRLLHLAGAGRAGILAFLAAETTLVLLIGCALAALAGTVTLGGLALALAKLTGTALITPPWPTAGALAAGCGVIALTTVMAVTVAERPWRGR